jgi:hypothetical protein
LAGQFNRRYQSGGATKAFSLGIISHTTSAVIFADRLKPRMEIIGMQNG